MKSLALSALVLAPVLALGADVEFKGVPLGATLSEFREKHPLSICERSGDQCRLSGLAADAHCIVLSKPRDSQCLADVEQAATYANEKADLIARFRDSALYMGIVSFQPRSYDNIVRALIERYGEPQERKNETVQNRNGAKFENQRVRWSIDGNVISVSRYSSNVNRGIASIVDRVESQRSIEGDIKRRKSAPGDL